MKPIDHTQGKTSKALGHTPEYIGEQSGRLADIFAEYAILGKHSILIEEIIKQFCLEDTLQTRYIVAQLVASMRH